MKYVFNTTIVVNNGTYRLSDISVEKAREILADGNFVSAIGHESTANIISTVLGIEVPMNRVNE